MNIIFSIIFIIFLLYSIILFIKWLISDKNYQKLCQYDVFSDDIINIRRINILSNKILKKSKKINAIKYAKYCLSIDDDLRKLKKYNFYSTNSDELNKATSFAKKIMTASKNKMTINYAKECLMIDNDIRILKKLDFESVNIDELRNNYNIAKKIIKKSKNKETIEYARKCIISSEQRIKSVCTKCNGSIELELYKDKIYCKKCLDTINICPKCGGTMTLRNTLNNIWSDFCPSCEAAEDNARLWHNM